MIGHTAHVGLLASITGMAALAQLDAIEAGSKLANMTVAGVLGVGCVVSAIAMIKMYLNVVATYREQQKRDDASRVEVSALVVNSTKAMQEAADNLRANTGVLVELKDAVKSCRKQ